MDRHADFDILQAFIIIQIVVNENYHKGNLALLIETDRSPNPFGRNFLPKACPNIYHQVGYNTCSVEFPNGG